jgi:hypothetical protein
MSTSFEVWPGTVRVPTFRAWVARAQAHMDTRMREYGVACAPRLSVELRDLQPDQRRACDADAPARWPGTRYVWFRVSGQAGGIDGYDFAVSEDERASFSEDMLQRAGDASRRALIDRCLSSGNCWSFRRSAGQPPLVVLAWGMVGVALAELTDGIVDSGEVGPWDYQRLPATAGEFRALFLRSDAQPPGQADAWTAACERRLRDEARGWPRS